MTATTTSTALFGDATAAIPFALVLLAIVIVPLVAPRLWHDARARFGLLACLAAPAAWQQTVVSPHALAHVGQEYVGFVLLLACLYALAGGIIVDGPFTGTPRSNVCLLALGASLASLVGTTGASMLLMGPLVRANHRRLKTAHTVVFYIFIVSNVGGLLLPMGDPPLFLGFLHGVPFFWTLRLWPAWAAANAGLLLLFYAIDRRMWALESQDVQQQALKLSRHPWRIIGAHQGIGFVALLATLLFGPALGLGFWQTQAILLALLCTARATCPAHISSYNKFSWAPMMEVATLFLPIFVAMPPALSVLVAHSQALPLHTASDFFWLSGGLSAFLDNAPCYMSFAALAQARAGLSGASLTSLAAHDVGSVWLAAIALGSVCMGAMTYIGNGPNLMVREAAARAGLSTPSFLGYLAWALCCLLPVLAVVRLLLDHGYLPV